MKIKTWERAWLAACGLAVLGILTYSVLDSVRRIGDDVNVRDKIAAPFEHSACAAIVSAPMAELEVYVDHERGGPCILVASVRRWRQESGRSASITASDLRAEPVATPRRFGEDVRFAWDLLSLPVVGLTLGCQRAGVSASEARVCPVGSRSVAPP
jgi:hypothetical protein